MKLLVIEDNQALGDSLRKHLRKRFVIDVARKGEDGLKNAFMTNYDLVILDLHLPDRNGYEVCQTLRAAGYNMPILILTAAADVPSRVALLNAGADDYVTKPFSMAELRARLNALLRRVSTMNTGVLLTIDDLVIDPGRRQVARAGVPIDLRRKEFDILEYLVRNRGTAVTRAKILEHAWDTNKETWHNTVDVHIKHLRDKIDRPFGTNLIKTAYGIGYLVDDAQ